MTGDSNPTPLALNRQAAPVDDKPRSVGLVVFKSPAAMDAELLAKEKLSSLETQQELKTSTLYTHLKAELDKAIFAKHRIQQELLDDLRQREGHYDEHDAAIVAQEGGTNAFDNVTDFKCEALTSWITDILVFQSGEMPFGLEPTPMPDLPKNIVAAIVKAQMEKVVAIAQQTGAVPDPELIKQAAASMRDQVERAIREEARRRAERMEVKMKDQLTESDFSEVFDDLLYYFSTFKAAILKGPCVREAEKLNWILRQDGSWVPETARELTYEFRAVHPMDFYPDPGIKNIAHGGCFERSRITPYNLQNLIGSPGFSEKAIREVLSQPTNNSYTDQYEAERFRIESGNNTTDVPQGQLYVMWERWGYVKGSILNDWYYENFGSTPFDEDKFYPISANFINNTVIRAVVNLDYLTGTKPYYMASYRRKASSVWGKGVPETMRSDQKAINVATRAEINNMSLCSLPQQTVNIDMLAAGEDPTNAYPGRIIQVTNSAENKGKAIDYWMPPFIAPQMEDMRAAKIKAVDDKTGIPPYIYGNEQASGAGSTLGGLQILMSSAAKGVKRAILNLDHGIIQPMLQRLYLMNMLYDPDESIKGDCKIVARGALTMFMNDQEAVRKTNYLSMVTKDQMLSQIAGVKGITKIFRDATKAQNIDPTGIIPSDEEIDAAMSIPAPQQLPPPGQQALSGRQQEVSAQAGQQAPPGPAAQVA